jgi:serine/threonine protein kinase
MGETALGRPLPQEVANRYVLSEFIGQGHRKAVYKGHDRNLDCVVAIALVRPEDVDRDPAVPIAMEGKVMGRLRQLDHVVDVFATGVEGPFAYIVTEYMQGGDLREAFARAQGDDAYPPLPLVVTLGVGMTEALAEVHEHGVVHHDVQPRNMWLDKANGTVHLGDFDLAAEVGEPRTSLVDALTNRMYLAPELAEEGITDLRSDLYALGASLYEAAVGRPPFSANPDEVVIQHLQVTPKRPSTLRPDIPAALDDLIMSLLAKRPSERPDSARAVLERLEALSRNAMASEDLKAMITDGEGLHTEFKASFRVPTAEHGGHTEDSGGLRKAIEKACAKSVAGFMNAEGGTLLVGVADNGEIVGIEPDFETLPSKRSDHTERDRWELCFRQAMKNYLGRTMTGISVSFVGIDYRTVAVVRCEPDGGPSGVWLEENASTQRFYLRTGNSTDELAPRDAVEYLAARR